jgi:hypothetical protein
MCKNKPITREDRVRFLSGSAKTPVQRNYINEPTNAAVGGNSFNLKNAKTKPLKLGE